METRAASYSASSNFSIDNILSDKKEGVATNFQFELQASTAEFARPNFQIYPPFLYGALNTWPPGASGPHYQPHGCPPLDRSRKTTGK